MTFDSAFDSICETISVIIDTDLSLKMLSRLLILSNVIVSNLVNRGKSRNLVFNVILEEKKIHRCLQLKMNRIQVGV